MEEVLSGRKVMIDEMDRIVDYTGNIDVDSILDSLFPRRLPRKRRGVYLTLGAVVLIGGWLVRGLLLRLRKSALSKPHCIIKQDGFTAADWNADLDTYTPTPEPDSVPHG